MKREKVFKNKQLAIDCFHTKELKIYELYFVEFITKVHSSSDGLTYFLKSSKSASVEKITKNYYFLYCLKTDQECI